jgi:hypothetical protein
MDLKCKFPGLASLASSEDVESALFRSKLVMEESRALTSKNCKKKKVIDEQLKNVLFRSEGSESVKIGEKLKNQSITDKTFDVGALFQEVQALNLKISAQAAYIKSLEGKVGELKVENEKLAEKNLKMRTQHKQEVENVSLMYEERIRKIGESHLEDIEGRMARLEEKVKAQDLNFGVIEEKVKSFRKIKSFVAGKNGRNEEKFEDRGKGRVNPCFEQKNGKMELNKTKRTKKSCSLLRRKPGRKNDGV